jgi:hypothetical protein
MSTASGSGAAPEGGWDIESVAAELLRCEDERREREPFTDEWPELDLDTGYAIQDLNLAKRLERGREADRASSSASPAGPSSSGWACTSRLSRG